MMAAKDSNGKISWQFLAIVAALGVSVAGGAIWLGSLSNQVAVNTNRLTKLENFSDDVRQHDANTIAEHKGFERRLDAIEKKVGK